MSPAKSPSSVAGLRRAADQAPVIGPPAEAAPAAPKPAERVKPVRVTLNFPPDLFRQLDQWTRTAADAIDAPRVGVQDAVRAMVRVITSGEARNAEGKIFAELRRDA